METTSSDERPAPVFQPVGPSPAHTLTLTISAARDGGYDIDGRCPCPFPSRGHLLDGSDVDPATWHRGWSALYGADDNEEDTEAAVAEAVRDWTAHRESCARRFGPAAWL